MFKRQYVYTQKYKRKDGTISVYANKNNQWTKTAKPYKKYAPRGESTLFSKRFGYMDSYTEQEKREVLKCPSGFSFNQGMGKLRKLWYAYTASKAQENIEKMMSYAKAIQEVQEDLGLKTTSFPHLGLYGEIFMLYEKQKRPAVLEDHRELQDAQKLLEKKQEIIILADEMNSIKKELSQQEETEPEPEQEEEEPKEKEEHLVPILLTPTPEQEIQIFADEIPVEPEPEPERKPLKFKLKLRPELKLKQSEKRKVKHENRICIKCGEELEKNHVCKKKQEEKEKKGLEILVMTDDIPFGQAGYDYYRYNQSLRASIS